MQRQRWHWLWIWVGVLVAGCGQFWSSNGTPAPTPEPSIPLWGYTLLPPSLTPPAWSSYTATPLIPVDAIPLHLAVIGPACYETTVGSLVCLGQVRNTLGIPVEQITIVVQLLTYDGQIVGVGETALARNVVPAGDTGPYRVLFDTVPDNYARQHVYVKSAQMASDVERRYASLVVSQVSGLFVINQYQVSLSIVNRSAVAADNIVLTMTLLDAEGYVTGFRQMVFGEDRRLLPGESMALTVKVIPQGEKTVGFKAFAEGRLSVR